MPCEQKITPLQLNGYRMQLIKLDRCAYLPWEIKGCISLKKLCQENTRQHRNNKRECGLKLQHDQLHFSMGNEKGFNLG